MALSCIVHSRVKTVAQFYTGFAALPAAYSLSCLTSVRALIAGNVFRLVCRRKATRSSTVSNMPSLVARSPTRALRADTETCLKRVMSGRTHPRCAEAVNPPKDYD